MLHASQDRTHAKHALSVFVMQIVHFSACDDFTAIAFALFTAWLCYLWLELARDCSFWCDCQEYAFTHV